jgi:hypothetical protein
MLDFAYLMPDCGLEVSLHSEESATGQFDEGLPWFYLVLEQMHCLLHMQPFPW